jgi:hypothetical protein
MLHERIYNAKDGTTTTTTIIIIIIIIINRAVSLVSISPDNVDPAFGCWHIVSW